MSNFKLVAAVAAMIGGMALLVSTVGRSYTDDMVGGGPWSSRAEMEKVAAGLEVRKAEKPERDAGWGGEEDFEPTTTEAAIPSKRIEARKGVSAGPSEGYGEEPTEETFE